MWTADTLENSLLMQSPTVFSHTSARSIRSNNIHMDESIHSIWNVYFFSLTICAIWSLVATVTEPRSETAKPNMSDCDFIDLGCKYSCCAFEMDVFITLLFYVISFLSPEHQHHWGFGFGSTFQFFTTSKLEQFETN